MSVVALLAGIGLFVVGVMVGILWCGQEVEEAVRILRRANRMHEEIREEIDDAVRRFQEQTRK